MNNSIFFRTRFCHSSFYRAIFLKSNILLAILCRGIILFSSVFYYKNNKEFSLIDAVLAVLRHELRECLIKIDCESVKYNNTKDRLKLILFII
jgi:hypothetical protein